MTFYINYTNGANLTAISDGTINTTSTSITLIGKNFPTYGQLLNQDLVSMLENFSNTTSPNNPLVGQLWYDSGNNLLKFYRGGTANNYWQTIPNLLYNATTPTSPQQSDFWWDATNQQLKFYDQMNWITVGPQTTNDGLNRVSGTNSFIVQIGGNNVFTVDAYGRVNAAYNPVVQGTGLSGNAVFTGSGLSTPSTMVPSAVPINIGSYFNTGTGVFTCPVAGIYFVTATATSLGYGSSAPDTTQSITWWKNQSPVNIASVVKNPSSLQSDTFNIQMVATGYIQCNAGDILQCVLAANVGGQIDYNNATLGIRLVG
jgi:hypothetical protein